MFGQIQSVDNISGRHWTCAGFWSITIILPISAVMLGAQQYLVLEGVETTDWQRFQSAVRTSSGTGWEAKPQTLFAMQCPLMMFSYAVTTFLAGLTAYVVSPFALRTEWNQDAKVSWNGCSFTHGC